MGFVDIIIGALLAFAFYKGLKNGLFVELASLIAFFIGVFIAIKFSYAVSDLLKDFFLWSSKTIQVFAFVLTLVFVVLGIHFIAKLLSSVANFAFLGWANILAGGVFAVLKSALLIGIFLNLFQKVNINDMMISKETQESSLFFNPCMKTSYFLLPILGDWFTDLKEKTANWDKKEVSAKSEEKNKSEEKM
ncbi:colicin V production protein [Flavobacterium davisii]|uniref:Colicin V production protein n=1 Tax=Flavobacterium davisii TaxID=2906077 RepID=A0A246GFD3_9FLAO|nr:CvpA family protein [Flavobacterium davisii]OWP82835.1 colicin V production protein [Flavobacterium davisii]